VSELKLCQGPKWHQYNTKDRLKGTQGSKTYQTRRRSNFYYGGNNFCSLNCQNDWFNKFGDMAINHFGRLHESKRQAASGAWYKDYKYKYNNDGLSFYDHYFVNDLLGERRPITTQQYDDESFVSP